MNARILPFAPLLTLLACGAPAAGDTSAGDTSASDTAAVALRGADVAGRWISGGCEAYPDGQGGETYLTRDFQLTEATWRLDLGIFGDAGCTYPLFSAEIEGPYSLGAASATVPGATEGDFGFERIVWTAWDADIAGYFTASGCGAAAWEVGVPQDVGATGCIGVAHPISECREEYDVVGLDGGQLHFGERVTDMCVIEGRPAALSAYGLDPR